jgi:ABC-type antimicrobial peptide transport system permease subunit
MLYGVTAHGSVELTLAAASLLIVAIIAAGVPALRAASIDPLQALRDDEEVWTGDSGQGRRF